MSDEQWIFPVTNLELQVCTGQLKLKAIALASNELAFPSRLNLDHANFTPLTFGTRPHWPIANLDLKSQLET